MAVKTPQVQYIVKIITWAECPETSPDHPDDPDDLRPCMVKGPVWPVRPSEVGDLRARQDPARSEP